MIYEFTAHSVHLQDSHHHLSSTSAVKKFVNSWTFILQKVEFIEFSQIHVHIHLTTNITHDFASHQTRMCNYAAHSQIWCFFMDIYHNQLLSIHEDLEINRWIDHVLKYQKSFASKSTVVKPVNCSPLEHTNEKILSLWMSNMFWK